MNTVATRRKTKSLGPPLTSIRLGGQTNRREEDQQERVFQRHVDRDPSAGEAVGHRQDDSDQAAAHDRRWHAESLEPGHALDQLTAGEEHHDRDQKRTKQIELELHGELPLTVCMTGSGDIRVLAEDARMSWVRPLIKGTRPFAGSAPAMRPSRVRSSFDGLPEGPLRYCRGVQRRNWTLVVQTPHPSNPRAASHPSGLPHLAYPIGDPEQRGFRESMGGRKGGEQYWHETRSRRL